MQLKYLHDGLLYDSVKSGDARRQPQPSSSLARLTRRVGTTVFANELYLSEAGTHVATYVDRLWPLTNLHRQNPLGLSGKSLTLRVTQCAPIYRAQ